MYIHKSPIMLGEILQRKKWLGIRPKWRKEKSRKKSCWGLHLLLSSSIVLNRLGWIGVCLVHLRLWAPQLSIEYLYLWRKKKYLRCSPTTWWEEPTNVTAEQMGTEIITWCRNCNYFSQNETHTGVLSKVKLLLSHHSFCLLHTFTSHSSHIS